MKPRLILTALLFAGLLGCKEKEKVDSASYLTVNGQTISLTRGFIFDYGTNPDLVSRYFQFVLSTDGITYDEDKKKMVGDGNFIFFDVSVDGTEQFVPGTFNWNANLAPNTLVNGFAGITCSFSDQNCSYQSYADGGTVTVDLSAKTYTINIDMTLVDGQTAVGYFKGPLFAR